MIISGIILLIIGLVLFFQSRGSAKKAVTEEDVQIREALDGKARQLRMISILSLILSLAAFGGMPTSSPCSRASWINSPARLPSQLKQGGCLPFFLFLAAMGSVFLLAGESGDREITLVMVLVLFLTAPLIGFVWGGRVLSGLAIAFLDLRPDGL